MFLFNHIYSSASCDFVSFVGTLEVNVKDQKSPIMSSILQQDAPNDKNNVLNKYLHCLSLARAV